jgi:hypothetical protein
LQVVLDAESDQAEDGDDHQGRGKDDGSAAACQPLFRHCLGP